MRILLTGATGYIGKRLLPVLINKGHEVICVVRDKHRFNPSVFGQSEIEVVECDFLEEKSLVNLPVDIDVAYYLVHSMSTSIKEFESMEKLSALHFRNRMEQTKVRQVIYLSGITNVRSLSRHLSSRRQVEQILSEGRYALTTLRAGIIVGSGSASFEIIRDLVEKLPVMVTPRWLNTRSQPIGITNVVQFLSGVIMLDCTFNKSIDIGGPSVLSYKEMLLQYARIRKLRRWIFVVPFISPKISSFWLYFITSTNYKLAVNLVNSMKIDIIVRKNDLHKKLGIHLYTYEEAVHMAFDTIRQQEVLSSWTDALANKSLYPGISRLIQVPTFGCYIDQRSALVKDPEKSLKRIWAIGGSRGWYYANFMWRFRGFLDEMVGGVGLRRGRKNQEELEIGDALDFWRVIYASREEKRLLLFAEMKMPGEAWLEFRIKDQVLYQTATFRPLGIWGRIYWYSILPMHNLIFSGMLNRLAS